MAKKRALRSSEVEAARSVAEAAVHCLSALAADDRLTPLIPELPTARRIAGEAVVQLEMLSRHLLTAAAPPDSLADQPDLVIATQDVLLTTEG